MKIIIDELCNQKISKRSGIHNIPITGNNDIS
jgi:hypothetical protein